MKKTGPIAILMVAILALSSCGDHLRSQPPPSLAHDDKDVKEVHCDKGASEVISPRSIAKKDDAGKEVRGRLSLLKAGDNCPLFYWGQFQPDSHSEGWYFVAVSSRGRVRRSPDSEGFGAAVWTHGIALHEHDEVRACIVVGTTRHDCIGIKVHSEAT